MRISTEFRKEFIANTNAFISLKYHNPKFSWYQEYRLNNPAKSETGKNSKYFLQQLISKVRDLSSVNQWQEVFIVINQCKNIKNKKNAFLFNLISKKFIVQFQKNYWWRLYVKTLVNISDAKINIIIHSRKSLLFNNTDIWIKKNVDLDFDVTMESFGGVELCKLVCLYILHILGEKYGEHRIFVWLWRISLF